MAKKFNPTAFGTDTNQAYSTAVLTTDINKLYASTDALLSSFNIDGTTYDIHDKAVDKIIPRLQDLAQGLNNINSDLADIESGLVSVDDTAVTNQFVTSIYLDNGDIKANRAQVTSAQVSRTATAEVTTSGSEQIALAGTTVEAALVELAKGVAKNKKDLATTIGADPDAINNSIATVKALYEEIKGSGTGISETIIDKLTTLTANLGQTAAIGEEGDPGYVAPRDITVAEYVQTQINNISTADRAYTDSSIAALDATVTSTSDPDALIAVSVVEADGVLTSVTVDDTNLASAIGDLETASHTHNTDVSFDNLSVSAAADANTGYYTATFTTSSISAAGTVATS